MLLVGHDFIDNNASFNTQLKRDGAKVLVYAYAGSGVDENKPVAIQFMGSGYNATALTQGPYAYVGVPDGTQSVGAGSWGWFIIRGPVENAQSSAAEASGEVGHAVIWATGVVCGSSSAYIGLAASGQIGVFTEEANLSTTISFYLVGAWARDQG